MSKKARALINQRSPHKKEIDALILQLLKNLRSPQNGFGAYVEIGRACVDVLPKIRKMGAFQEFLDADLQSIFQNAISTVSVELTQDDGGVFTGTDHGHFGQMYVQAVNGLIAEGIEQFEVLVPLPALPRPECDIQICEGFLLSKVSKLVFGLTTETYFPGFGVDAEMTVLRMQVSGYYHYSSGHSLPVAVLSKLREFLIYADLLGIVKVAPGLTPLEFGSSPPISILANRMSGMGYFPILAERKPLYNHLCALLLGEIPPRGLLEVGDPITPYERHLGVLSKIGALLTCPDDDPDLVQIRRAIQWAFEATLADDVSVAMVQSFVALESLLTDPLTTENSGQISARLAERYAYLVGTTFTDRAQRAQELKDLYKVRGDLLHGKLDRSVLDAAHGHRWKLHQVVRQTLWAELDRLIDLKAGNSSSLL